MKKTTMHEILSFSMTNYITGSALGLTYYPQIWNPPNVYNISNLLDTDELDGAPKIE